MNIIDQYKQLHETGLWFKGTAIKGHVDAIGRVVKETGSKTLLDYGCGKAIYYRKERIHEKWGVKMPYLYDPGVTEFEKKPVGKFDGVICTDVLEHVENPEEVISDLIGYAEKFLYLCISVQNSPPGKHLPDGRPFHICVKPKDWWRERINPPKDLKLILKFDTDPK